MNDYKQKALGEIELRFRDEILDTVHTRDVLARTVSALPDELDIQLNILHSRIDIDLPYDMRRVREVRRILGESWKPTSKNYATVNQDSGFLSLELTNGEFLLKIYAFTQLQESTCKKVLVGEDVITTKVPRYKIVCGDQLRENQNAESGKS